MPETSYVLVTAAYNEDAYIGKVLDSVVKQTLPPLRWVIASDASTDRTDEIVSEYAAKYPFIQLLRLGAEHKRNFAAQVHAIGAAYPELRSLDYAFVGNLDADVSFEPSYFAELLKHFEANSNLGLAGGFIYESEDGVFRSRRTNAVRSVAHAVQFFRRRCFDDIGGYQPLKYGGSDWFAEVSARMKGWKVHSVPDLHVQHHRRTGSADSWHRDRMRQGRMDYALGSHPLFELVKCVRRIPEYPWLIGALTRLATFLWCYCRRESRPVSSEFMRFLRNEQVDRLRAMLRPSGIGGTE
ncbi:MAG TPA: glycosyltransferase family A protein [Terriglobales bacterium]|jgi:glycosyltransferase involved in cell wall biosynthesis|nr:glycosyltransferase family A protein [Terriglobales bacterium]